MPLARRPLRAAAAVAATIILMSLVACVPGIDLPENCDAASVTFQATLVEERLEPNTFDACRGQQVTIRFNIQRDGVLHLHGYDEQVPAQEVRSGETVEFAFEARQAGQFPIAIHTQDGPAEATVGTLIVHEP